EHRHRRLPRRRRCSFQPDRADPGEDDHPRSRIGRRSRTPTCGVGDAVVNRRCRIGGLIQRGIRMKAIVVTDRAAGTAGMKLVERPDPDAARLASLEGANYGDVVVEVHASGFTGNELEWPSTWIDRL